MASALHIAESYATAFERLNGYRPQVLQHGKRLRFRVVNRVGAFDYSARELESLTAGLAMLAAKRGL